MELKRIAVNKEVIIRKLPSNKYITREITKNDKTDCSANEGESVTECPNLPIENIIHQKKTITRLTKTKIASTNN